MDSVAPLNVEIPDITVSLPELRRCRACGSGMGTDAAFEVCAFCLYQARRVLAYSDRHIDSPPSARDFDESLDRQVKEIGHSVVMIESMGVYGATGHHAGVMSPCDGTAVTYSPHGYTPALEPRGWLKIDIKDLWPDPNIREFYFSRKTGVDSTGQFFIVGVLCNSCGADGETTFAEEGKMYCERCMGRGFMDENEDLIQEAMQMASELEDCNSLDEIGSSIESLLAVAKRLDKMFDQFTDNV